MKSPDVDSCAVENVVLVVSDSLRADTAAEYMPALQALGDDHGRYTSCFSVGSHTPSSMTGLMQSRQPVNGGYGAPLPSSIPTLAEPLAEDGVRCGGWHCNPHTTAQRDFDRGFEVYADLIRDPPMHAPGEGEGATKTNRNIARHTIKEAADALHVRSAVNRVASILKNWGLLSVDPRVPAAELVNAYQQWLSEFNARRRFAYLHFMDTHMPYKPPDSHWEHSSITPISTRRAEQLYQRLSDDSVDLSDEELSDLRDLYHAEAEYVDREIDRLVSHLQSTGRWESTLLIVTADHGELFDDRVAPDGSITGHPGYLCEELVHVPLVLAGGPVASFTDNSLVSGLDVAPTVTKALDVAVPEQWRGDALGESGREFALSSVATPWGEPPDTINEEYVHVSVRSSDTSLLWWDRDRDRVPEWYVRGKSGENAADASAVEEADTMLKLAEEYQDVSFEDVIDPGDEDIAEQRLRDLGYV